MSHRLVTASTIGLARASSRIATPAIRFAYSSGYSVSRSRNRGKAGLLG